MATPPLPREWPTVPRMSRTIPFGYKVSEEDKDILQPIPFELEALEKARQHMRKGFSLRDTAEWLSKVTGRYISHMGLKKRIDNDRRKRLQVGGFEHAAKRLTEILEAKKRLEERAGVGTPIRPASEHNSGDGEQQDL